MNTATDERPPAPIEPGVDRSDLPRPVRGRALWVIFGSLLLIGGFWWGTFNVVELIAHEERTERFTVPAEQLTRLLVDNDTGSITIVGTATDEISVEAEVSEGLRDTGFSHEVVGSTLELHGSCPLIGSMWCRVTYRIEVPRGLDVEVNADNDRVEVQQHRRRRRDRLRQRRGRTRRRVRRDRRRRRQRPRRRHRPVEPPSSTSTPTTAVSSWRSPSRPIAVNANGDNGSIEIVVARDRGRLRRRRLTRPTALPMTSTCSTIPSRRTSSAWRPTTGRSPCTPSGSGRSRDRDVLTRMFDDGSRRLVIPG